MAATMVDMYVPLFGQRLAHLAPVAAGFLGVALAIGWTVSEIASASVSRTRVIVRIVAVAPLVMATGLALAAVSQFEDASGGLIAIWVVALLHHRRAGSAWRGRTCRHGRWAASTIPSEGGRAAAAINTVQLIFGAFGAGLAGIVVNTTDRGDATAARWLFAVVRGAGRRRALLRRTGLGDADLSGVSAGLAASRLRRLLLLAGDGRFDELGDGGEGGVVEDDHCQVDVDVETLFDVIDKADCEHRVNAHVEQSDRGVDGAGRNPQV